MTSAVGTDGAAAIAPGTTLPPVDIVVPVYNACDDLVRCVDSVLAHTRDGYRLLLIDDASPDPRIGAYFDALAARRLPQLVLLVNPVNLGFTGTVNRGIAVGGPAGGDVVLLNSDAVVTAGWLDALLRCAASNPHIGTITPFSNNAEICSFPVFCADNRWADGDDPEPVRRALARSAVPTYPELPTGVGFCMYIRRELIQGIGVFDEAAFGRGYGEENDFCVRGFRAGWRNVLCDDAFVLHTGARSFSADKAALAAANLRTLCARHPHYEAMVRDYVARDPLRPLRDAALTQLARDTAARIGVLHVVHGMGGGTERHVRTLIDATRNEFRHFLAVVTGPDWRVEEHAGDGSVRSHAFERGADESLRDLLGGIGATFGIGVVHLHNVMSCRDGMGEALRELRIPYGYTVHDLSFTCPTVTLQRPDGLYCGGETDVAACRRCLAGQPAFAGTDIVAWRATHRAILAGAAYVLAPTQWTADLVARYFPGIAIDVVPHGLPEPPRSPTPDAAGRPAPTTAVLLPQDDVPTVAVVGAIGPDKGARRLERLVELARARAANVRFVLIGYLDVLQQPWQSGDARLTVHGRYQPQELAVLLAHYRARLVAYPSAGPETFSYTLSETWAAGLPALVPPFGALAERVAATGAGLTWSSDEWRDEGRMLERLLAVLDDPAALARAAGKARAHRATTVAEMAARTGAHYVRHAAAAGPAAPPLPAARVRDALGYALWWPPEPEPPSSSGTATFGSPVGAPDSPAILAPPSPSRPRSSRARRLLRRLLPARLAAVLRERIRR